MRKQNFKKMLNLRSFALIAIFSVAVFATSCNKEDDEYIPSESEMMLKKGHADAGKPDDVPRAAPAPGNSTIADIVFAAANAEVEPEFTLLFAALEYAGLTGEFVKDDQLTVFAPTDQAFSNLVTDVSDLVDPTILANDGPFAAIDALLGAGTVKNVLLYHVTEGRRAANSVVPRNGERIIETLLEDATFAVQTDGTIKDADMRDAQIFKANISASNGIIHVITEVILPIDL